MGGRVFVDTNVLVYLFDHDAPSKRSIAGAILQDEELDFVVSTQVLQEFYVAVTRKLAAPLSPTDALLAVRQFSELSVAQIDTHTVIGAIELSQRHQVSLWDALMIEAALASRCDRLLTEDLQAGWRLGHLVVENPFANLADGH